MVYPSFKVDIPAEACYNVLVSFGWSQETLAKLSTVEAGVSFLLRYFKTAANLSYIY